MLADYHIHTSFSNDSDYEMEEVIRHAIKSGLHEICMTEHVDYFLNDDTHLLCYKDYFKKLEEMKVKYANELLIKTGAEFGVQIQTIQKYRQDFAEHKFDFIILSNHQINDIEFWTGDYQKGKKQQQYNEDYYQAIYDVISVYQDYSVLGHLDMIKRYDPAGIMDDRKVESLIKEILKTVIRDGKGIEVNTSCYRYGLPDLTPSRTILEWYYELGGRIITIGSDSHKEGDLGYRIRDTQLELKKLGFKEF